MARNTKKEYLLKLLKTETPNGYKFDINNYLRNPSFDYEYPSFTKVLSDDGETMVIRDVIYFKCYDGTGYYKAETKTFKKSESCGDWNIARDVKTERLADSNRFSLKTLVSYC